MATYTSENVKQFLEGSAEISREREMIVQFLRMVAAGIGRALKMTDGARGRNTIDLDFHRQADHEPILFCIEWESKICASGYNVKVWWDLTNLLTEGADSLGAKMVVQLYDQLPVILEMITNRFPSLIPDIQFFMDTAKRR